MEKASEGYTSRPSVITPGMTPDGLCIVFASAQACASVCIIVQDYSRERPPEAAGDKPLQAILPCASVASPDHGRCCIPIILSLWCAWIILNSTEFPSHGITLAQHEVQRAV
jgi:hypothetical protein